MQLAERSKVIGHSWIGESLRLLETHPETISLGAGEPDFLAPPNVVKAAQKFLRMGYTHYSTHNGRHELREAISEKLKQDNNIHALPDEVLVTCGSSEALMLACMTVLDPGDEVIIPDPAYVSYKPMVRALNGKPVSLRLREEDSFEIHPDEMRKMITRKTRMVIINTPSNPTGTVFSKKVLEEIADIIVDNDIIALADEAYEKLVYGSSSHLSLASLNGMENYTITAQSFSKTYAMCGMRVGYAVASENTIKEMTEFKTCTTLSTPTAFQMAAVEALRNSEKYTEKMREEYDRRRKFVSKRLDEMNGVTHNTPKGAFYIFANIKKTGMTSEKFANFLLHRAKVIVIPGTEFGQYGEGYVRMSYATAPEKLEKAMDRMEEALRKHK